MLISNCSIGLFAKDPKPSVSDSSEKGPPQSSLAFDEEKAIQLKRVLRAASRFQRTVLTDYSMALDQYATKDGRKKFEVLNKHLWADTEPPVGWFFFMNVSMVTMAGVQGEKPLIVFYNPWCDAFLITVWEARKDRPQTQMVDVEMVKGDWIRMPDNFPSKDPSRQPAIGGSSGPNSRRRPIGD